MKSVWLAALAVVLVVTHMAQTEALINNGCPESFCPEGTCNCTCGTTSRQGSYELFCPMGFWMRGGQPAIVVDVAPSDRGAVEIRCHGDHNFSDVELLQGLHLGPKKAFIVKLCPLSSVPYRQLMLDTHVNRVKILTVESFSNYSNQLTRHHLSDLGDITQLNLNNNMMTDIPEDLFFETGNLTLLNLRDNLLRLPKNIFRPVSKLEILELGSNNLTYLEPGIFRDLTKLRLLNLWGNRLRNLSRRLFSDLINLESLDLSSNRLTTLPPDIFSDLSNLTKINLYGNSFTSLPQGLFLSNLKLQIFQLNFNRAVLKEIPPGFLSNLPALKEVIMDHSNVNSLPKDLIWNSPSITNLSLSWNGISVLPALLFRDNVNLLDVEMAHNVIESVPDRMFAFQQQLVKLNLSFNKIRNISGELFVGLSTLLKLDLSHNQISEVARNTFFPSSLTHVDLSWNEISDLTYSRSSFLNDPPSVFNNVVGIKSLKLAHNRLSKIHSDWRFSMTALEEIDLSFNTISQVTSDDINFTSGPVVNLTFNNISIVDFHKLERDALMAFANISTTELINKSSRLHLKGNPFNCDCNAYDFMRLLRGKMTPEVNYLVQMEDGNELTCHDPAILHSKVVKDVNPNDVNCVWVSSAVDGRLDECPPKCTCRYRPFNSALLIDCSSRGMKSWPEVLPPASAASANHTELYFFNNSLTDAPSRMDASYRNVTHLYLSLNYLSSINVSHFSPHLQELELNDNNFSSFGGSLPAIEKLPALRRITLMNNPWICDCDAKPFLDFIRSNYHKVRHYKNITCTFEDGVSDNVMVNLSDTDLCPISATATIIGIFIAVMGLLIGGLCAVYYRYQKEIKVWLYANRLCLWFVTEDELDKDKKYDAFISYSHQDESFVVNDLVSVLENNSPKYKLCLHYRDWIVGDFIPNQIARSVEESRRTVVVVSPNFIESVWGRMEFRTAHQQALTEGRARVIIILYGEIGDTEKLDPELKAYLSMNTYVKWGDPWFWEKLFYALPHPPEITKGIPSLFRRRPKSQTSNGSEKLVVATSENGFATTPPAFNIIEPLKTLSNTKPI